MKSIYKRSLLYLILVMSTSPVFAIHIQGMDLTYTCSGNNTYTFTLHFYRDCAGIVPVIRPLYIKSASNNYSAQVTLTQAGNALDISPVVNGYLTQTTCNGGFYPGSQQWTYQGTIQLPYYAKDWVFYYNDNALNPSITTIENAGDVGIRITDSLDNSSGQSFNSPVFTNEPVFYVVDDGIPFTYNNGAFDADGDSLAYRLTPPLDTNAEPLQYIQNQFESFNYDSVLSETPGVPFSFDHATGQLSFTPAIGIQQMTMTAARVYIYRAKKVVGYVTRQLEIVTVDANNTIPTASPIQNLNGGVATGSTSFKVSANTKAAFQITATDLNVPKEAITVTTNASLVLPGATVTVTDTNPAKINVSWTPSFMDSGYHNFTVTVKDDHTPIIGEQVYSYQIYVPSISETTGIANLVTASSLSVNPNPFSNQTVLQYALTSDNVLTINVFDVIGRKVQQVMSNEGISKGVHEQTLNLESLPSGIYFIDVMNSNSQHSYAKIIKQ